MYCVQQLSGWLSNAQMIPMSMVMATMVNPMNRVMSSLVAPISLFSCYLADASLYCGCTC